jgi:hypothetical protein
VLTKIGAAANVELVEIVDIERPDKRGAPICVARRRDPLLGILNIRAASDDRIFSSRVDTPAKRAEATQFTTRRASICSGHCLPSGQITMRKVHGWQTLTEKPIAQCISCYLLHSRVSQGPIRILIADNHPIALAGIRSLIGGMPTLR